MPATARYPVILVVLALALAACQPAPALTPAPAAATSAAAPAATAPATQPSMATPVGVATTAAAPTTAPTTVPTTVPTEAPVATPAGAATRAAAPAEIPAAAPTEPPAETPVAVVAMPALTASPGTPAPHDIALTTFNTANFAGSGNCQACHADLKDAAGKSVSITNQWRSTTMANAAKDPFWQAKVSSEVKRAPDLQAVVEDKCANCHTPMAEVQAKADGGKPLVLGQGFLDAQNPLHAAAMDGVSCTLCHQVEDKDLGQKTSFSGGYTVDTAARAPDRPLYGPYADPVNPELHQGTVGYKPMLGKQMGTSEMCATCHNLYTPYVDAAGQVQGEFPEQAPYTEWQQSSYNSKMTCAGCHMPAAAGKVAISTMPSDVPPREPFVQHQFAGGNGVILDILRDHGAELGATADAAQFDATRALVNGLLGKSSATLALKDLALADGQLQVVLQIATLTGHKFPTSFPVRRAWLHVTLADAGGKVVFESGRPESDGRISGNAADEKPAAYEPHYDVITQPDQVQIYEAIMGNTDGQVTYTLLRGSQFLKDNRLLPAGFAKDRAPKDVAVYGEATGDANFVGGGDTITYKVDVKNAGGPFTVKAELLYQPISYREVQDLSADGTGLTQQFVQYWQTTDKAPAQVAAAEGKTR